jgi:hypothetical protein
MDLPPDERIPVLSYSAVALERDKAAWMDVPLLHGGLRPFSVRPSESVFWSPPFTISRWSDALTFNDDRLPPIPCVLLQGDDGAVGPGGLVVSPGSGGAPADLYVLNSDRIWQSSLLLATNQITVDRPPYGPTSRPPNLIVLSEMRGSTPIELDARLREVVAATPLSPILLVLGEVSSNGVLSTGILGDLSPVHLPTSPVETGPFQVADSVLSLQDTVRSRVRPTLKPGAETVWWYADGVPLLVRGIVDGVETWFLNAQLDPANPRSTATTLNEVMARIKGGAVKVSISTIEGTLTIDLVPAVNSAVPDHAVPQLKLVESRMPLPDGITVAAADGTTRLRVVVDGAAFVDEPLNSADVRSYTIMSGPIAIGTMAVAGRSDA